MNTADSLISNYCKGNLNEDIHLSIEIGRTCKQLARKVNLYYLFSHYPKLTSSGKRRSMMIIDHSDDDYVQTEIYLY